MTAKELRSLIGGMVDEIDAKYDTLMGFDPVPYINTQVLCQGMRNALAQYMAGEIKHIPTTHKNAYIASYAEALLGIINTLSEQQPPSTCVYIARKEVERMLKESTLGGEK